MINHQLNFFIFLILILIIYFHFKDVRLYNMNLLVYFLFKFIILINFRFKLSISPIHLFDYLSVLFPVIFTEVNIYFLFLRLIIILLNHFIINSTWSSLFRVVRYFIIEILV
jgi:hypothetical protein